MQSIDSINKNLKSIFTLFAKSNDLKKIREQYHSQQNLPNEIKCHIGLMVTGSSLVRSGTKINEIHETYHGVIGLDMETHGFYFAASNVLKDKIPYFASI